jgi:hypothetical protein
MTTVSLKPKRSLDAIIASIEAGAMYLPSQETQPLQARVTDPVRRVSPVVTELSPKH